MIRTDEGRMNSALQTLMSGCLRFFIVSDSDISIITQLHRSFFQVYTPYIGRFLKFRTCDIWTFEKIIILAVKISFFTVINRICNLAILWNSCQNCQNSFFFTCQKGQIFPAAGQDPRAVPKNKIKWKNRFSGEEGHKLLDIEYWRLEKEILTTPYEI